MKLSYYQLKGPSKKVSEDAFVINEHANLFGVFDGATPLVDFTNEEGFNGAYLAANLFRNYFSSKKSYPNLDKHVIKCNDLLKKLMIKNGIDMKEKHHLWSTCVVIISLHRELIELAHLGDSMIIIEQSDGKITLLTKDTLKGLNDRAKKKRAKDRKKGIPLPDEEVYEKDIKRKLIYNRWLANTKEGYSVANGMEEAAEFIDFQRIDRKLVKSVLLLSDGLFHPELSLTDIFLEVQKKGIESYIHSLQNFEESNGLYSDDKTGIFLEL
ncbi:protein phosphatase 2C domain-containing protein [Metabacillus arenae]|uniref:Protein phosphatase 2C domain-containing protein n=1 Tax=Metabacillus arenae TaxID=2771434 RepID=A0A926RUV4_9BACI|nr:protein phosphatase 2C domain-containing protein [Metabacillus arenae]MBD1378978.1 protein phosphatase 2C domain-containing protein [Metabacillus arenae]